MIKFERSRWRDEKNGWLVARSRFGNHSLQMVLQDGDEKEIEVIYNYLEGRLLECMNRKGELN